MTTRDHAAERRALQEAARLLSISYRGAQGRQTERDQFLAYARQTTEAELLDFAIAAGQLGALAIMSLAKHKEVDFEVVLQHLLDTASADLDP